MPAPSVHPQSIAIAVPTAVATTICAIAPGIATRRTAIRSATEKWRPTPNISRITPISASWPAISALATRSGAKTPITTPAIR